MQIHIWFIYLIYVLHIYFIMNSIVDESLFSVHSFEGEAKGNTLLILAGVHGDEYEPILAANELIDVFRKGILKGKVVIVPIANQSAFDLDSRVGSDGLDLARVCPGDEKGSITERVGYRITELIKDADYLVDMHTGGKQLDIYPLAGYMLHADENVLMKQRAMAKAFGFPVIWGTDPTPNGRTLSVARDANIPAIYLEYGGGNSIRKEVIVAYVKGCLNVATSLGIINNGSEIISPKFHVEDYTPNGGHLQVKQPSPESGLFIPCVSNGNKISKGDIWGVVKNLETGFSVNSCADDNGIVLFIRNTAFVKKGDSLGGILPLKNN